MGFFDRLKQAANKAADAANDAIGKAGKSDVWAKLTDAAGQFADAAKEAGSQIRDMARQADYESQFRGKTETGRQSYWAEAVIPASIPRNRGTNEYFMSLIAANLPDVGMQQSKKTASESVAQSNGGFRFKGKRSIIHPQLL